SPCPCRDLRPRAASLLQGILAAPTPPGHPSGGSRCSAPLAARDKYVRPLRYLPQKRLPISHSAAPAPSAVPRSVYTNPACSPSPPLPVAPDVALATGCEY